MNVFGLNIPSFIEDWQLTEPQVGMLGSRILSKANPDFTPYKF